MYESTTICVLVGESIVRSAASAKQVDAPIIRRKSLK